MIVPYTTIEVANWFIAKARESKCFDLNHMKIQKLVYISHGWYLDLYDKPLVNEEVYAASYGPYFATLYMTLIETSNAAITGEIVGVKFDGDQVSKCIPVVDPEDSEVIALLERIWEVYGQWTPYQCSTYCHDRRSAWRMVADRFKKHKDDDELEVPPGVVIPPDLIKLTFNRQRGDDGDDSSQSV